MNVTGLDHISVAVRDMEQAERNWEQVLGRKAGAHSTPEETPHTQFFFGDGKPYIELLSSTSPDGEVAKFVERRGEGLYLACFRVDDVSAAAAELKDLGYRVFQYGEEHTTFIHPKDLNGVLLEITEREER